MLKIDGQAQGGFCDGFSRRDFLRVGAFGGLTLPQLLRAEAEVGVGRSHKALIMIYMAGAPPHQDLVDLKPNAPREYRGELNPIRTNVPGIHISELLPRLARIMDKWTAIRSIVGAPSGAHDSFMCYSGRKGSTFNTNGQAPGGWPSIGATLSKLEGARTEGIPPFIGLAPKAGHPPYGASGKPGFLGVGHGPFKPTNHSRADMSLQDISIGRFGARLYHFCRGEDDRHVREGRASKSVSSETTLSTDTGDLGVQLQALKRHAGAGFGVHVGRAVERAFAELVLDIERCAIGDRVCAYLGRSEIP